MKKITFKQAIKPFEPYIKRYSFYIHFNNDKMLWNDEFIKLIHKLYKGDLTKYNKKVTDWCKKYAI